MIATIMTVAAAVFMGALLSEREQGPKLAYVLQLLQSVHVLDASPGPPGAQHRLHQRLCLRSDGRGVQWILLRARRMTCKVADCSTVTERHLDQTAAWSGRILQRTICLHLHAPLPR